jgi:hypothetical protein
MCRKRRIKNPVAVLFAIALGTFAGSCEDVQKLHLDLLEKTPPSFPVSGEPRAVDFVILELAKDETLSDPWDPKGETIWKISPLKKMRAKEWPVITYSDIPDGFAQKVPEHGRPRNLAEGHIYAAELYDSTSASVTLYFAIRGGKPVNVTDEMLGRAGRRPSDSSPQRSPPH